MVCLPHDYLNWRLTGELTTDRGDASGSGWWSPATGDHRPDLLALAIGNAATRIQFPRVLGPEEPAGVLAGGAATELGLPAGIPVGPGSGDNPAAAVGVGATDDELVVSLGTSGTAYAVSNSPTADPSGEVAGFADATGRFLPLTCMVNCTRVFDSIASMMGIERIEALDRAGRIAAGASGLLLMPYLNGERTPNLPRATGLMVGLTSATASPDLMLRAAVDAIAAGLAYCVEALRRAGVVAPLITLVGGGSRHATWQQAIADAAGLPVTVRAGAEHVARGAAIQAAAIVRGQQVADLAGIWRPEVVAELAPRVLEQAAYHLDRRQGIIDRLRGEEF
jgi:xylulokinase